MIFGESGSKAVNARNRIDGLTDFIQIPFGGCRRRTTRSRCESFTSYNTCYKDTGLFGWYVVCDAQAVQPCVERLLIGAANIGNEVTEEELDRAKHHLRMSLFGALDGTTAIAEDVGRQLLVYGRRMTAPEFCLRVAAVTVDDVRRCARQHFCDANIALTGLGRVEGLAPR